MHHFAMDSYVFVHFCPVGPSIHDILCYVFNQYVFIFYYVILNKIKPYWLRLLVWLSGCTTGTNFSAITSEFGLTIGSSEHMLFFPFFAVPWLTFCHSVYRRAFINLWIERNLCYFMQLYYIWNWSMVLHSKIWIVFFICFIIGNQL